jgi:hypothetical protein
VKKLVKQKVGELSLYGADKKPLIVINKAAVHSVELLYEYSSKTIDYLFNDTSVEKGSNDSTNISNNISKKELVVRALY